MADDQSDKNEQYTFKVWWREPDLQRSGEELRTAINAILEQNPGISLPQAFIELIKKNPEMVAPDADTISKRLSL
jgi:hypothetical protein